MEIDQENIESQNGDSIANFTFLDNIKNSILKIDNTGKKGIGFLIKSSIKGKLFFGLITNYSTIDKISI